MTPKSFYKANITLITKPGKDNTTVIKSQYLWRILMQTCSTTGLQAVLNNALKDHTPWPSGIYFNHARVFQHLLINQHKKLPLEIKDKNHIIFLIHTEKALNMIQHSFITKNLNKLCTEGVCLCVLTCSALCISLWPYGL